MVGRELIMRRYTCDSEVPVAVPDGHPQKLDPYPGGNDAVSWAFTFGFEFAIRSSTAVILV